MRQTELVADIEQIAVSAVNLAIARCDHLVGYISSNDRTPITDGHIDLYEGEAKVKGNLTARVPVQVKGRATQSSIKPTTQSIRYSINADDLKFFSRNGGGLYFYVPMRSDGSDPEVFYANLHPFRISRFTRGKKSGQKMHTFDFRRLPAESGTIEALVALSAKQASQSNFLDVSNNIMSSARSITIHSLRGLNEDNPAEFNLDHDEYAVFVTVDGGLEVPVDIDFSVFPQDYMRRPLPTDVSSGGVTYRSPDAQRIAPTELAIYCSDGVTVHLFEKDGTIRSKVDITLRGGVRQQLGDVTFFLALAEGEPLVVHGNASTSHTIQFDDIDEVRATKNVLSGLVALFDYFDVDDDLLSTLTFTSQETRELFRLYRALILGEEVAATGDGSGRWDYPVAGHKIVLLVTDGSGPEHKKFSDPIDPAARNRLRLMSTNEDDAPEEIRWATVYETLTTEDYATALNLHLDQIVDVYASLEDNATRYKLASDVVLKLLTAADRTPERRSHLLRRGQALNGWILNATQGDIVHRINRWQFLTRLGELSNADRRDIAAARRQSNFGPATLQIEACLAILRGDNDDLELILDEMTDAARAELEGWPIWALTGTTSALST